MNKKPVNLPRDKDNEILALIISALLSDGYMRGDALIKFINKDLVLINHFKGAIKKYFKLGDERIKGNFGYKGEKDVKCIYICSVDITRFLRRYVRNYRTKPYRDKNKGLFAYPLSSVPKFVMVGSREHKITFLKTYISCDGCVEFNVMYIKKEKRYYARGNLSFICHHPKIYHQILELLIDLGYTPIKKFGIIRITKKEEIKRFANEVGFVKKCRISNSSRRVHFYWKCKNDVLLLLIHALYVGVPQKLMRCEKSKGNKLKIISYLRWVLELIESGKNLPQKREKMNYGFLTNNEKVWLFKNKNKVFQRKVSYQGLADLFLGKFNKSITPQAIYYQFKKYKNV